MNSQQEIRSLLQTFQDGYIHRDVSQLEAFMELFTPDAEVIGTNGIKPGLDEWYTSRASARELVQGDWESWGDLRLDLEFVKEFIDTSTLPPEQKLHYILRGGTNTVYELRRGENFIWALRLTAVVVREACTWKFAQMNFSFPTIYFPDVRIMDQA